MKDQNIDIQRECEHHIIIKNDFVMITQVLEFVHNEDELNHVDKFARTSVSIVNQKFDPQICKISGIGKTPKEAYSKLFEKWNLNRMDFYEENKQLLCCSEIPELSLEDLRPFPLTRRIVCTWYHKEELQTLFAYVKNTVDGLCYIYDGSTDIHYANTDKEIIHNIIPKLKGEEPVLRCKLKRAKFYPTYENFVR